VAGELCFGMRGIIPGDTMPERIARPDLGSLLRAKATQELLNEFLARAATAARAEFGGQITYCALPTEQVDWTGFDVAAVDLYRDRLNRPHFGRAVQVFRNKAGGRPLIIGEFGCCTYQGAADRAAQASTSSIMPATSTTSTATTCATRRGKPKRSPSAWISSTKAARTSRSCTPSSSP
jgi:hypothetical protein